MAGADQYTVLNTDSNGNYTSPAMGIAAGASTAFEAFEPSFQQDLNGDGIIGIVGGTLTSLSADSAAITGDFNGDGNTDLLWRNSDDTVTIHEMNGSTIAGTADLSGPPLSWRLVGTADLNGDGKSDILWQDRDGAVSIWDMNGTSIASIVSPGNPGAAWQLQGASDVNGDGKSDLLFFNPTTNQSQTWLMNGTQVVSIEAPAGSSSDARQMAGGAQIGTLTAPDSGVTSSVLART
jgi:hypothetical protein